jgi:hypothetical protein
MNKAFWAHPELRMQGRRRLAFLATSTGLLLSWPLGVAAAGSSSAPPLPEAIQATRVAADAVLAQSGTEHCLRGKLTNALLGLTASCEAGGQRSELCAFADQVVVTSGWSVAFMEQTARRLLELTKAAALKP